MKKYYIVKMYHHNFKCTQENNVDMFKLINSFIVNQNKGEAKSDRIKLKSIKRVDKKVYDDSILFDETYKL